MLSWRLVDLLSRTLAPEEREAVRGDLVESGASGIRALGEVFGLIFRRQAAPWKHGAPWLALLCLVLPLGISLLWMSRRTATLTAVYSWLYVNNWTTGYLAAGFREDLIHNAAFAALSYFKLIFAAWSAGLAVGFLARRSIRINGFLFLLMLLAGPLLTAHDKGGGNAPVFALNFYRLMLPFIVMVLFIVIPAFRGMHDGLRFSRRFSHEAN